MVVWNSVREGAACYGLQGGRTGHEGAGSTWLHCVNCLCWRHLPHATGGLGGVTQGAECVVQGGTVWYGGGVCGTGGECVVRGLCEVEVSAEGVQQVDRWFSTAQD